MSGSNTPKPLTREEVLPRSVDTAATSAESCQRRNPREAGKDIAGFSTASEGAPEIETEDADGNAATSSVATRS